MKRYIYNNVLKDLKKKMVFITGPRQVGKTYLAKDIMKNFFNPVYLNYDNLDHQRIIVKRTMPPDFDIIIFDEIPKMQGWKMYLKGFFDVLNEGQSILVTGSSRLETFRQTGESLAGRYFHFRLNPLSVRELIDIYRPEKALKKLIELGSFPEPFLSDSIEYATRWRKQYYTDLIREDILDFSRINEIRKMQYLVQILRERVGALLSYNSIAEDLQLSVPTVKTYISILESLYIIFLVKPFHKNLSRALQKMPKIYFYDTGYVKSDEGLKLENIVALSLLKSVQYLEDAKGRDVKLRYIRTKDGKKVDFAIEEEGQIKKLIEVKVSDNTPSKNLYYFKKIFKSAEAIQVVKNLFNEEYRGGIKIVRLANFLANLEA